MYKIVIADDETAIRRGMSNFIDWASLGFEVAADFEDGGEVIEYLKENRVDVVLTDIRMITVSGLEVAEYVQQNCPDTFVVIISSYREFEYARKAVQYNVEYYLTKPIEIEEVTKVFEGIREKLSIKEQEAAEETGAGEGLEQMLPELQNHFFASLLLGVPLNPEDLQKKLVMLNLPVDPEGYYAVIHLKLQGGIPGKQNETLLSGTNFIRNIFGDTDAFFFAVVSLSPEEHRVVAYSRDAAGAVEFRKSLEEYVDVNLGSVQKLLGVGIQAEIEDVYQSIYGFEQRKYFLQTETRNLTEDPLENAEEYDDVLQQYRLLMDLIDSGEFQELDKVLDHIFFSYRNLPAEQLKHFALNMFTLLSNKYRKMGSDEWELINRKLEQKRFYDITAKNEIMNACREILHETRESFETKHSDTARTAVSHALEYMKQHYSEALSLSGVAERYYLNPSYFSRIFKENTGETFTDSLIAIRMEEAMKLLRKGELKVYEISEKVGYASEKYFFRVFKQYTGMSPAEYQRSVSLRKHED